MTDTAAPASDPIERAARALCAIDDVDPDSSLGGDRQNFLWMEYANVQVSAVLNAMRKPNEAMVAAGGLQVGLDGHHISPQIAGWAWERMIDAALAD